MATCCAEGNDAGSGAFAAQEEEEAESGSGGGWRRGGEVDELGPPAPRLGVRLPPFPVSSPDTNRTGIEMYYNIIRYVVLLYIKKAPFMCLLGFRVQLPPFPVPSPETKYAMHHLSVFQALYAASVFQ